MIAVLSTCIVCCSYIIFACCALRLPDVMISQVYYHVSLNNKKSLNLMLLMLALMIFLLHVYFLADFEIDQGISLLSVFH